MTQVTDKFNHSHPERKVDEVFVGNYDHQTYPRCGWKTKRMGVVSYDEKGNRLGKGWEGSFPVFAKISELESREAGMTARMLP